MKANNKFLNLDLQFWANVKFISNKYGYSDSMPRGTKLKDNVKIPPEIDEIKKFLNDQKVAIPEIKTVSVEDIIIIYKKEKFDLSIIEKKDGNPTAYCQLLSDYFNYRAKILNSTVEPMLMDAKTAKLEFEKLQKSFKPTIPFPKNKQKGNKKVVLYFTSIINMLIEKTLNSSDFDHNPRKLIMFTEENVPSRLLSRTVDGAFPSIINPKSIWEIKEYYFTTTFGSRVADGIYESLLDGLELKEVEESIARSTKHYLFVDAYFTWWIQGKSYLCRMVDMMHMGLIDEVIFGKEVITRLPEIVKTWPTDE